MRVDTGLATGRDQRFPAIALAADGQLSVAWLDDRSGRAEVFLARSADRGGRFGAAGPLHAGDPLVADRAGVQLAIASSGRLLAAWTEQRADRWQVRLAVSLDGGQSFTAPRLVESTPAGDQTFPALAAGPDAVYVAWQDARSGPDRLRVARSRDGGDTFEPSVLVDDPGAAEGGQRQPALVVDGRGDLLAAWLDFTRADGGVYFARSSR